MLVVREFSHRHDRRDGLILGEVEQVDDRLSASGPTTDRDLPHLDPVALAAAREDHDVVVRGRHEEVFNPVLVLGIHAAQATATTALGPVGVEREALHVALMGNREHHILLDDQVLDIEGANRLDDLGPPVVAVLFGNGAQLVLEDVHSPVFGLQDVAQVLDDEAYLVELVIELVDLEPRKARESHVQDRFHLTLRQLERLAQLL